MQNIKGTGLDFVYRWEAWCACHKACEQLLQDDPAIAERGLKSLAAFREYGVLCEEYVTATLEVARNLPALQSETLQAELAVVGSNFELGMAKVREKQGAVQKKASRFEKVLASVEGFVDAGDAVKRRRRANLIYQDLLDERISIERAAMELQAINKRQKGGWLQQKLLAAQRSLSRNVSSFLMRRVK